MRFNVREIIQRAEKNFQSLTERELEIYYTHCHQCFGEFDSTGNCPKYCMPTERDSDDEDGNPCA